MSEIVIAICNDLHVVVENISSGSVIIYPLGYTKHRYGSIFVDIIDDHINICGWRTHTAAVDLINPNQDFIINIVKTVSEMFRFKGYLVIKQKGSK